MDLRDHLLASLRDAGLGHGPVVVAVSGGPDSMALLDLLLETRSAHGLTPIVAHADHGIHPASAGTAATVAAFTASSGVTWETTQLELGPAASETAAREARYAWLGRVRQAHSALAILTAHHADDQAETVLMRLLAGSGPAGLAGMAPQHGWVVRPLLGVRHALLAEYCEARGLPVWHDPANADPLHLRSWLRRDVLPAVAGRIPEVVERLGRTARLARGDRDAWDAALGLLPGLACSAEPDGISVAAAPFAGYDSALSAAILGALGRRIGCPIGPRRAARLLELARSGGSGHWVPLGGACRGEVAFGRLRIVRPALSVSELELIAPAGEAPWGGWVVRWRRAPAPAAHQRRSMTAWFVADALRVRPARPGDRLRPVGGPGTRLLARCFQEAKIPRSRRAGWPVVSGDDAVVWVPGVSRADSLIPEPGVEALRVDITDR
jgi:tRNA(Ile)-lysidine synthetase-like protein